MSFGAGPGVGTGGQAFYGHGTPGPIGTVTLTTGTAGIIRGALGAEKSQLARLVQAVVRFQGNLGDATDAEQGPVWAELWLVRGNALIMLLDKGFVRAGGARGATSVVGMVGSISVSLGDELAARIANDAGATLTLELDACTAPPDPSVADGLTTLSTEPDATYLFRGTVAEDATAGTHVASVTFTLGAGDVLEIETGRVTVGNTATSQVAEVLFTDGVGTLSWILNPDAIGGTAANLVYIFPQGTQQLPATLAADVDFLLTGVRLRIYGPMTVVMRVTTTAVSVTQAFVLVGRVKGRAPVVTIGDTVGLPVNTIATNLVE